MKLPIPKMDLKTMAGVAFGIAVLIWWFQKDLQAALNSGIALITSPWGIGIIAGAVIVWWFSQKMKERLVAEIPPPATVMKWCCEHAPEFREAGIYYDDIDWSPLSFHPVIANNRMAANFRLRDSGLQYFVRVDVSPAHYLKITLFEQGWKSQSDMDKLLRPEMMLDSAKQMVKEDKEKYEETKEE